MRLLLLFICFVVHAAFAKPCDAILAPKIFDFSTIHPTIKKHGFEFLKGPIDIAREEAQGLVDSVRQYFKINDLPIHHINVAVMDEDKYLVTHRAFPSNRDVQKYLLQNNNPTLLKIRSQVGEILANPEKYIQLSGYPCEVLTVGLRIGFKESPLYDHSHYEEGEIKELANKGREFFLSFHQDQVFTRIISTLLGTPTELYSPYHNMRMDIPIGTGTHIIGEYVDKEVAAWHRAPALLPEDRIFLVISCLPLERPKS